MAHRNDVAVPHSQERSLGDLFSELSRDMSFLVRKEVELVRVEVSRELSKVGKDATAIGIGAALLYAGVLAIVATIVLIMIKLGVTPWLASLITGLVVLAIGYAMAQRGRTNLKHESLMPRRATRQAKETVQWAKEQVS
jgi:xanthine/uracil permease